MTEPEFSHSVDVRQSDGKHVELVADKAERAALANRFALVRVEQLEADVLLRRKGRVVDARGTLRARWVQPCAVSAEDLPVSFEEDIAFRFVPPREGVEPDEEIEISADECDEIDYVGTHIDIGEAVAQSLGLAIDPYATGPEADEARTKLSDVEESPFAALKEFKPKA